MIQGAAHRARGVVDQRRGELGDHAVDPLGPQARWTPREAAPHAHAPAGGPGQRPSCAPSSLPGAAADTASAARSATTRASGRSTAAARAEGAPVAAASSAGAPAPASAASSAAGDSGLDPRPPPTSLGRRLPRHARAPPPRTGDRAAHGAASVCSANSAGDGAARGKPAAPYAPRTAPRGPAPARCSRAERVEDGADRRGAARRSRAPAPRPRPRALTAPTPAPGENALVALPAAAPDRPRRPTRRWRARMVGTLPLATAAWASCAATRARSTSASAHGGLGKIGGLSAPAHLREAGASRRTAGAPRRQRVPGRATLLGQPLLDPAEPVGTEQPLQQLGALSGVAVQELANWPCGNRTTWWNCSADMPSRSDSSASTSPARVERELPTAPALSSHSSSATLAGSVVPPTPRTLGRSCAGERVIRSRRPAIETSSRTLVRASAERVVGAQPAGAPGTRHPAVESEGKAVEHRRLTGARLPVHKEEAALPEAVEVDLDVCGERAERARAPAVGPHLRPPPVRRAERVERRCKQTAPPRGGRRSRARG